MITPATRLRIFTRDNWRCVNCLHQYLNDPSMLDVDHRIPKSLGGPDTESNYQTMCSRCNRRKGNREGWELLSKREQRKKPLMQSRKIPSRPLPKRPKGKGMA